ncbi:hypothetical protein D3C72_1784690 [compost metagenome]
MLFGQVQIVDTGLVVHVTARSFRAMGLDNAVVTVGDVALADLAAPFDQLVFAFALFHQEEHIDPIQRLYGLHRDVVGIARTDANDQ